MLNALLPCYCTTTKMNQMRIANGRSQVLVGGTVLMVSGGEGWVGNVSNVPSEMHNVARLIGGSPVTSTVGPWGKGVKNNSQPSALCGGAGTPSTIPNEPVPNVTTRKQSFVYEPNCPNVFKFATFQRSGCGIRTVRQCRPNVRVRNECENVCYVTARPQRRRVYKRGSVATPVSETRKRHRRNTTGPSVQQEGRHRRVHGRWRRCAVPPARTAQRPSRSSPLPAAQTGKAGGGSGGGAYRGVGGEPVVG